MNASHPEAVEGATMKMNHFVLCFPKHPFFIHIYQKTKKMHLCLSLAIPLDILQCVCVVYMRQDNGLFVYLPFDTGPPSPID